MFAPDLPYTVSSIKAIINRSEQRGFWMRQETIDLRFYGVFHAPTKRLLKQAILELRETGFWPHNCWYVAANQSPIQWIWERGYDKTRAAWLKRRFFKKRNNLG